jgi:hypothetical protein
MTVAQFITAMTKNPNLLKEELCIVTRTESVVGGQFDGSVMLHCRPVQSVTFGVNGVLLFATPDIEKKETVFEDLTQYPGIVLAGPTPDSLKI